MRFNVFAMLYRTVVVRGAVALALGLSLILGSLAAGPSASAEGPAPSSQGAVFFGYVFTATPGTLPEYVRAMGPTGAVCGTAEVQYVSDYAGSYTLRVAASDQKRGCPAPGGVVQFLLLAGRVDDGVWAAQVETLVSGDGARPLYLQAATSVMGDWAGQRGEIGRDAWLRWAGPSVSLVDAVAAMPLAATTVYYLDPASGAFVEVTSRTDAVLTAGDLVLARFR